MTSQQRTFPADPAQVTEVRRFVSECARSAAVTDLLPDLLIAASEAAANAILHSGTTEFRIIWRSTPTRVEITIEDDGLFVDGVSIPEIDGVAHRGISLMAATMDELSLVEGRDERPGTTVQLVKIVSSRRPTARGRERPGRRSRSVA